MRTLPCVCLFLLCLPLSAVPLELEEGAVVEAVESLESYVPPEAAAQALLEEVFALSDGCYVLQRCFSQPALQEWVELALPRAQARLRACRERLAGCPGELAREHLLPLLDGCERLLRGEEVEVMNGYVPESLLSLLPEDAAGEPCLTAVKARARLQAAREALALAFAEQEYRRVAWAGEPSTAQLHDLLRLTADFRREMQLWRGSAGYWRRR